MAPGQIKRRVIRENQSVEDGQGSDLQATEFKAKCLEILDRISRRELGRVVITKRGRVLAMLTTPETESAQVELLHGFLRGSVVVPEGVDLASPFLEDDSTADRGEVHR